MLTNAFSTIPTNEGFVQGFVAIVISQLGNVVGFPLPAGRADIRQYHCVWIYDSPFVFYLRHERGKIEVLSASVGRVIEAPCNKNSLLFPIALPDFL